MKSKSIFWVQARQSMQPWPHPLEAVTSWVWSQMVEKRRRSGSKHVHLCAKVQWWCVLFFANDRHITLERVMMLLDNLSHNFSERCSRDFLWLTETALLSSKARDHAEALHNLSSLFCKITSLSKISRHEVPNFEEITPKRIRRWHAQAHCVVY